MFSFKRLPYLFFIILILISAVLGFRAAENPSFAQLQKTENNGTPAPDRFESDPVVQLIGKSSEDIKQLLGDPNELGFSSWLGPHNYILYHFRDGYIRFGFPVNEENSIATSIIVGPGQKILGTRVGMDFSEIIAILGKPDYGPEPGINNQYYIGYYWGKLSNQVPEYTISFAADDIGAPTQDMFIKWEGYKD